jgi:phage tail sheath gpL-like
MALTGLSPTRRTPGIVREFVFGAGISSGVSSDRPVLIFGNKTSAGSEATNTIGAPIASDEDCVLRFGRKSEARLLYRYFVSIDPNARIYIIAPPEAGGATAATIDITFAGGTATTATTGVVTILGQDVTFPIASGNTVTDVAASCVAAINAFDDGSLPLTATNVAGVVTLTTANLGPRQDYVLARVRASIQAPTSLVTTTVSVGSVISGTNEDDFSVAIATAALGEYTYQISPKFSTSTPTTTDNGVGEHIAMIREQALPVNGKSQMVTFGLVGTQAQSSSVATDVDANSVYAFFFASKNSDWTPGMIAAHCSGVMRSQQMVDPAANLAGYANTTTTKFLCPVPYSKSDWWTPTEIEQLLKDGVCPIGARATGQAYIVRHITSRSLNDQGTKDYRASEGHITSVMFAIWDVLSTRYGEQKQGKVSDDPIPGAKPVPGVDTPNTLAALIRNIFVDASGPAPFGVYASPLLDPSPAVLQSSLDSILVTRRPGGLAATFNMYAVQHNLFSEFTLREASPAY